MLIALRVERGVGGTVRRVGSETKAWRPRGAGVVRFTLGLGDRFGAGMSRMWLVGESMIVTLGIGVLLFAASAGLVERAAGKGYGVMMRLSLRMLCAAGMATLGVCGAAASAQLGSATITNSRYVTTANTGPLNLQRFTVEAWIKPTGVG